MKTRKQGRPRKQAVIDELQDQIKILDSYGNLPSAHRSRSCLDEALRLLTERVCVHCGCSDSQACPGGCGWLIEHRATRTGVCSRCVGKAIRDTDRL